MAENCSTLDTTRVLFVGLPSSSFRSDQLFASEGDPYGLMYMYVSMVAANNTAEMPYSIAVVCHHIGEQPDRFMWTGGLYPDTV